MTNLELALNILAEATTTEISKARNPRGFQESKVVAQEGGSIVGNTRREIEARTGKKVTTSKNAADLQRLEEGTKTES